MYATNSPKVAFKIPRQQSLTQNQPQRAQSNFFAVYANHRRKMIKQIILREKLSKSALITPEAVPKAILNECL
ncbi:hypothetical protein Cabys_3770 [Caldithrix abyssi DSM 13497]|uniref:Uncharacterized protein n=2 Tax=Caldithrix abyssi TaxID=187145 RepID=A0A1J1CCS9_CALAY|nr:hypothetical protein Cabys_3770 [Caldithrix abyssi DSM 13497]